MRRGLLLFLVCAAEVAAQPASRRRFTATIQTGFADTFQLTLGGTFGEGPAWQNRVLFGVANALKSGDSAYVYGWDTMDTPTQSNDWQAGVGYKLAPARRGKHAFGLNLGFQHWRFPSVKTGTNDWLAYYQPSYQTRLGKLPLIVTSDWWTLLKSPLPTGTLAHTQGWIEHSIVKRDDFTMAFRHGPAHTYSWNFYGTHGNRVVRYQTLVVMNWHKTTLEGGYRKQLGLQKGIPDNGYWQFAISRTF